MPSGRDSFRRNRVAPTDSLILPLAPRSGRATDFEQLVPANTTLSSRPFFTGRLEGAYISLLLINNWAQRNGRAVESKTPSSQNANTGNFGGHTLENCDGTGTQRR